MEFFLAPGFAFTHKTVRNWEERFAKIFVDELSAKLKGKVGKVWHVDETNLLRKSPLYGYLERVCGEAGIESS